MSMTRSRVADMDSAESQLVVTMQRPDSRSQSIDRPIQPGMLWTAGITSSRTMRIPSSMRCGSAVRVVERAYMPPSFRMAGGAPAASPRRRSCSGRRLLTRVPRSPPSGDDVRDDVLALLGRAHVVILDRRPRRQVRRLGGEVLVGDLPEQVGDHVEAGALLDVGLDDPPRGLGD